VAQDKTKIRTSRGPNFEEIEQSDEYVLLENDGNVIGNGINGQRVATHANGLNLHYGASGLNGPLTTGGDSEPPKTTKRLHNEGADLNHIKGSRYTDYENGRPEAVCEQYHDGALWTLQACLT
jgi:hypothetical protein